MYVGREDQRNEVFKIAKQMKKTNQDVVGEKCIRNDEGNLASTEEEKKLAWNVGANTLLPGVSSGLHCTWPLSCSHLFISCWLVQVLYHSFRGETLSLAK